jgi:hypothetical protein
MKAALLITLALAATPAMAQAPDWSKAQSISITMTADGYVPHRIPLRRGGLYVLHVSNRSDKGHNLTQEAFFRSARVHPDDRDLTRDGQLVLKSGERMTIHFRAPTTPAGGTYQFSSTVLADADSDYKGVFVMR